MTRITQIIFFLFVQFVSFVAKMILSYEQYSTDFR